MIVINIIDNDNDFFRFLLISYFYVFREFNSCFVLFCYLGIHEL